MSTPDRSATARRLRGVAAPPGHPVAGNSLTPGAATPPGGAAGGSAVGPCDGLPGPGGVLGPAGAACQRESVPAVAPAADGRVPSAMRVAADDYARTHPDPREDDDEEPAPGGVQRLREARRMRWSVSWRAAGSAALAVTLVVGAVVLRSVALTPGAAVELPDPVPLGTGDPGAAGGVTPRPTSSAGAAQVVVHVVGAVGAPGVVRLAAGARVLDAVAAAGGATGDADLARLNLARVLVDGEQVVVPRPGDPDPPAEASPRDGAAGGLLDLNAATLAQLDELPGVGPVLAQRIVDRRPFTSVDELDEVSGVGPTLLERLRPLVRV